MSAEQNDSRFEILKQRCILTKNLENRRDSNKLQIRNMTENYLPNKYKTEIKDVKIIKTVE